MSNMSYCRFRNTDLDLVDVQDTLDELFDPSSEETLSEKEIEAAARLVSRCLEIADAVLSRNDPDLVNVSLSDLVERFATSKGRAELRDTIAAASSEHTDMESTDGPVRS